MTTLVLVACSGMKLDRPAVARDLYSSPLFKKSRAWAERNGDEWEILSALHGLIEPGQYIAPYDLTLSRMSVRYRRDWAEHARNGLRVLLALRKPVRPITKIIFLCGKLYEDALPPETLAEACFPLRGLEIGERLAWLNRELAKAKEVRS